MIHLEEITNKNIWQVCKLQSIDDQKTFVADNIISIAEAYATRNEGNNALPLAVYHDEELIGFVMIGKGTIGNEEPNDLISNNYCLWRFMIDKKYQGKGYAKLILDAVIELIKTFPFGKAQKVWLSYEAENIHAKNVYQKYGFVETGEICDGEVVAVFKL